MESSISQRVMKSERVAQVESEPRIRPHHRTPQGVSVDLRWDPHVRLDLPTVNKILVAIHVGRAAKLHCRRGGRTYNGTSVHGDIDVIPMHLGKDQ